MAGKAGTGRWPACHPQPSHPYAGYRFPGEVISHAVWLYFRFPLSLRMVEEMLAARGIDVSHGAPGDRQEVDGASPSR